MRVETRTKTTVAHAAVGMGTTHKWARAKLWEWYESRSVICKQYIIVSRMFWFDTFPFLKKQTNKKQFRLDVSATLLTTWSSVLYVCKVWLDLIKYAQISHLMKPKS